MEQTKSSGSNVPFVQIEEESPSMAAEAASSNFDAISASNTSPSITQKVLELMQGLTEFMKSGANVATDGLGKVVEVVNSIPDRIRENTIFTSKVVATNVIALSDEVAGAANPKKPPVTQENMKLIEFLSSKHPDTYQKVVEHASKTKDLLPEQRAYEHILFCDTILKPLINQSS